MDFEQFKSEMIDEMRDRFPECDISIQDVSKLQGESYTGMAVRTEDCPVAATLSLEALYSRMNDGVSLGDVMEMATQDIQNAIDRLPRIDIHSLVDYEQMKDKLTLQMIPIAGNEEKLSGIPHKEVEDMALVYRFEMESNEQGSASILATNAMISSYGISVDQLHADAMEVAVQNHPATLRNMSDVIRDMMGEDGGMFVPNEPSPMWVATVETGQNGACVVQYPEFLDQAAETLGGDFFVLPSSVHEVLLVADDGSMELDHLEQMVRDVNETQVAPTDRLTDNVYHYDSEAHVFENARTFEARETAKEEAMLADEPESTPLDQADTVTVLLVEPNEHPKVIEAKTGLSDLQALVGGYIEVTYPYEDEVGLIMNEEGKLNGMPLNRAIRDENGEVQDIIAGPFLVVGLTEDNFGSLTGEQIGKFEEMFHQPEAFVKMGRSIMALPIPEEKLDAMASKAKAPEEIVDKPKHKKPERDGH